MNTAAAQKYMSDKTAKTLTWIISVVVFGAVALLGSGILPKPPVPALVYSFPKWIAIINGTCSVILICSFIAIKSKKISLHKFFNYSAMALSGVFLILYVTTHFFIPDTRFGDINHDGVTDAAEKAAAGGIRYVYLIVLMTHILFASIVLPMVLLSFHYGRTNNVVKHRKLTRYSFPVWLYVTITGVVVYLMISPYYNF